MKTLVISVRGLRPDFLGSYGNAWVSTPALDRLAASGVVFDWHFADVPEAGAARATWRDGRHRPPGGALPPGADLLELLRSRGVRTVLVADGSQEFPASFLDGWDEAEVVTETEHVLERTLETARAALEELAGTSDWLLWVDLATLLPPWRAPAEFTDPYFEPAEDEDEAEGEDDPLTPWPDPPTGPVDVSDDLDFARLQASYAGPVSYVDAGVGSLLDDLDELGLAGDCLVVVTADHGLPLGDHGYCGVHRPWMYDELVHLPLLLRLPSGRAEADQSRGVRADGLTGAVDLMPTLLEAFGVAVPESVHGRSLWPLLEPEADWPRDYVCSGLSAGAAVGWGLRTAEWALLVPGADETGDPPRPQLFVKPDDRCEVNNVVQHHLERAEALERTLRDFVAAVYAPGPFRPPPQLARSASDGPVAGAPG